VLALALLQKRPWPGEVVRIELSAPDPEDRYQKPLELIHENAPDVTHLVVGAPDGETVISFNGMCFANLVELSIHRAELVDFTGAKFPLLRALAIGFVTARARERSTATFDLAETPVLTASAIDYHVIE
jgi:hypothetical protein